MKLLVKKNEDEALLIDGWTGDIIAKAETSKNSNEILFRAPLVRKNTVEICVDVNTAKLRRELTEILRDSIYRIKF